MRRRRLHTTALPEMTVRFIILVAICILSAGLVSGCQQIASTPDGVKHVKQSLQERLLYARNGVVYESDLSGKETRKIFSSKYKDPSTYAKFRYFPAKRVFVYTVFDENRRRKSNSVDLREYSLITKKDRKIDSIDYIMSAEDESGVLYAKQQTTPGSVGSPIPSNEIFLYVPDSDIRSLGLQNISSAVVNTETAEICYSSYTPIKEFVDPPNSIYTSKLDKIEPQFIASFSERTSAMPFDLSREHIIYTWSESNEGPHPVSLHLFDRDTKRSRLIEDKITPIAINRARKTVLIAKEDTASKRGTYSIWEIQYEKNIKTKLFSIYLIGGGAGPLNTKYSPDEQYIVTLNGWDFNLGVYDFSNKRYRMLFDKKDESVKDFIFTPDGKSVLFTAGKPPTSSTWDKNSIYKIDLESGKITAIVTPSNLESSGHELIKLIGVYKY